MLTTEALTTKTDVTTSQSMVWLSTTKAVSFRYTSPSLTIVKTANTIRNTHHATTSRPTDQLAAHTTPRLTNHLAAQGIVYTTPDLPII